MRLKSLQQEAPASSTTGTTTSPAHIPRLRANSSGPAGPLVSLAAFNPPQGLVSREPRSSQSQPPSRQALPPPQQQSCSCSQIGPAEMTGLRPSQRPIKIARIRWCRPLSTAPSLFTLTIVPDSALKQFLGPHTPLRDRSGEISDGNIQALDVLSGQRCPAGRSSAAVSRLRPGIPACQNSGYGTCPLCRGPH